MKRLLIVLLALLLSLSACAKRAPAEDPSAASAVPTATPAPKTVYARIVRDREQTYGKGSFVQTHFGWLPCGVARVVLEDLNGDGLMELLLWENTVSEDDQGNPIPDAAKIEVWTYDNITGEAVCLYEGDPLRGGDPAAQYLSLVKLDRQWTLLTGEAGGVLDVEYRALRYGSFEIVRTVREEYADGAVTLYLNGEPMGVEDYRAMEAAETRRDLCNSFYVHEDDVRQLLNATNYTRQSLGI